MHLKYNPQTNHSTVVAICVKVRLSFSSGYWHALVLFFGAYFFFEGDTLGPAMLVSDHCLYYSRVQCYVHSGYLLTSIFRHA